MNITDRKLLKRLQEKENKVSVSYTVRPSIAEMFKVKVSKMDKRLKKKTSASQVIEALMIEFLDLPKNVKSALK